MHHLTTQELHNTKFVMNLKVPCKFFYIRTVSYLYLIFIVVCANKKISTQITSKLHPALQTVLTFDLLAFLFEVYPALSHWVFSRNQNLVSITYVKLRWRALATFPDYNQQNIISPTNQYMETHPRKWYHPDSTKHAQTEQWHSCTGRSPQKEKKPNTPTVNYTQRQTGQ